jgi:hypothetical protein
MPTADGYNQELKRDIYRDLAAKQHLAQRMAHSRRVSACDATETETAEDYCKRMLEKLGLKASTNPIADLTMFLHGHETGTREAGGDGRRGAGMDGTNDNPVAKLIRERMEGQT